MKKRTLCERATQLLLNAIAYKFEVRAEIHEALTGIGGGAHCAARHLSSTIADNYSGRPVSKGKLERALDYAGFQ